MKKICTGCGKEFETPDITQRYCSFNCRMKAVRGRQFEAERAKAERDRRNQERARRPFWCNC